MKRIVSLSIVTFVACTFFSHFAHALPKVNGKFHNKTDLKPENFVIRVEWSCQSIHPKYIGCDNEIKHIAVDKSGSFTIPSYSYPWTAFVKSATFRFKYEGEKDISLATDNQFASFEEGVTGFDQYKRGLEDVTLYQFNLQGKLSLSSGEDLETWFKPSKEGSPHIDFNLALGIDSTVKNSRITDTRKLHRFEELDLRRYAREKQNNVFDFQPLVVPVLGEPVDRYTIHFGLTRDVSRNKRKVYFYYFNDQTPMRNAFPEPMQKIKIDDEGGGRAFIQGDGEGKAGRWWWYLGGNNQKYHPKNLDGEFVYP